LPEVAEMKRRGDRIVMITAYDAPSARIADAAGVDLILVGDSAAMVVLGHDSTVPATTEEMIILTRAVTRGAHRPLVIADLPFGSYQVSDEQALETAIRFVKEAQADAVKLEGAGLMLARVRALTGAGIPVMEPIGLTPQTATMLGGFKAQGRSAEGSEALRRRTGPASRRLFLDRARGGAVTRRWADHGGARHTDDRDRRRRSCDGQVLVWHDLLGLYEGHAPRFVKQYAELAPTIGAAVEQYASEVRDGSFPEEGTRTR
jgi:3-methyl-2-oxobutanoate hydroxymethyltransferase